MAGNQEGTQNATLTRVGEETPAEDYQQLIKEHVEQCDDDELRSENFEKYSGQIRKIIHSMIFRVPQAPREDILRTLKIYRDEAGYYNPYDYNDWIKVVKEKLLEKQMSEFWEEIIVKNELGLLWAKDCDFFDDMDDPEPPEFYKFQDTSTGECSDSKRMRLHQEGGPRPSGSGEDKINTADDYLRLVREKIEEGNPDGDEDEKMALFDHYSKQVQEILTEDILNATAFDFVKLARDLKIYRDKACFYNPYDYNDWIQEIKIMLIEKNMIECWDNVICKNQLGLLWAKDCDFFDDMDDEEPEKFYKIDDESDTSANDVKEISMTTPAEDYKALIQREVEDLDSDREDERLDIFDNISKQMRGIIEYLLFNDEKKEPEKAAEGVRAYRAEACFYNPYDYNDWIKELKAKLVKEKMFDFWENIIVKDQLGLLWARDCDFFDDVDDKEPENFYKIQK